MAPRFARLAPFCTGTAAVPLSIAPPWIQTITGSHFAVRGAQTFRYKQSSLFGLVIQVAVWEHAGAKARAALTPFHGTTGCGLRQRRSPTGGAAKGIPKYSSSEPSSDPETIPAVTFTGRVAGDAWLTCARQRPKKAAAMAVIRKHFIVSSPLLFCAKWTLRRTRRAAVLRRRGVGPVRAATIL